jgi:hypothetical protein
VSALSAITAAFLVAGLFIGGAWGTAVTVLALLANLAWLAATFVRWWRQASDNHRRAMLAATGAYLVGWLAIRAAAGPFAAWALGLAGIGFFGLMGGVFLATGALTVHHANREQAAIVAIEASRHRRELSQ